MWLLCSLEGFFFLFSVPSSAEEQTQKKIGETEKLKITGRDLFQFDQNTHTHTHRERESFVLFVIFRLRTRVWMSCDYRKSFSLCPWKTKNAFLFEFVCKISCVSSNFVSSLFQFCTSSKYFCCCWISPIVCVPCVCYFAHPIGFCLTFFTPQLRYNSKTTNGWLLPLFSRRIARIVQHTQLDDDDDMMTRPLYDTKRSARSPTHRHTHTLQRTYVSFFPPYYSFLFL